jgi:C4-dicarboxylate-specific signal transduction histidine kinase
LFEDALRLHTAALEQQHTRIIREFDPVPDVFVDIHRVLQILVNLIGNATWALSQSSAAEHILTLGIHLNGENLLRISVADNGIGIPAENLKRIFTHGFTTRRDGHGFGLHSAILAAREMDGDLAAQSEGTGRGATFVLELPCRTAEPVDQK